MKTQFLLTVAQGKRLIAKAFVKLPEVQSKLKEGRILLISGTTNAYIAQELLKEIGVTESFDPGAFYRGITVPVGQKINGRPFSGDVYIVNGKWEKGATIDKVAADMGNGDIIVKGANAINLFERSAAILVGSNVGGTAMHLMGAYYGRRARVYIAAGVEKLVSEPIAELVKKMCETDVPGPRLMSIPGEVFTELDALESLFGVKASLVAKGGVLGAEGGAYFLCEGSEENINALNDAVRVLHGEGNLAF